MKSNQLRFARTLRPVTEVTGELARFFRLYEKRQPALSEIPALDNRDLGKTGQPGVYIKAK